MLYRWFQAEHGYLGTPYHLGWVGNTLKAVQLREPVSRFIYVPTQQALFSEATQIRNRANTQLANYAESMTQDNKSQCQYGIAYAMQ